MTGCLSILRKPRRRRNRTGKTGFFPMKAVHKRILIVFTCCLLFFLCLEASARLILLYTPLLDSKTILSDSYFRLKLIRACHNNGGQQFTAGNYLYEPVRGWVLKPNLNINDPKAPENILHTNSKGIRAESEYAYQKQGDEKRILILGDSFTFGAEVPDNEAYPYYLEKMVPGSRS